MKAIFEVLGIRCLKCKDEIWSRHVHDFRWCKCKCVAVDGGRHYLKITGHQDDFETCTIRVVTEVEDD